METLRKNWCILGALAVLFCCMGLVSCGDDDENGGGGFSGYYIGDYFMPELEDGYDQFGEPGFVSGYCFHFVNGNTVEVVDFRVSETSSNSFYQGSYKGHTYYFNATSRKTYTYVIEDGKIYITNGTIGTVSGGSFTEDGGDRYVKFA